MLVLFQGSTRLRRVLTVGLWIAAVFWIPFPAGGQEEAAATLVRALSQGRVEEVRRLLESGVPPTPFHLFIAVNRREAGELVPLLVGRGADPNLLALTPDDPPREALLFLAISGEAAKIRLLMELGADPDFRLSPEGMTPLMAGAMQGDLEVVSALLDQGADPSLTDADGQTALSWATVKAMGSGDDAVVNRLSGASPEGETVMNLLQNGLDMDGTFQPGFQSLREEETLYAPGPFTGPCLTRRNPFMDPAHPSPGETGSGSVRETHVWFEGGMSVGLISPPECAPLHLGPAKYRVEVWGGDFSWTWVCSYERGGDCLRVRREDQGEMVRYEFTVGVEEDAPPVENPDDPCEVESLTITLPDPDSQFTYDDSPHGILSVRATVEAQPSTCGQAIRWSMEEIGEVTADQDPSGSSVEFRFQGLPRAHDAFGPKVIRAEVGEVSDEITVEVFFDPTAWNNPGEGATPNWFHYWQQTRAGSGKTSYYTPELRSETVEAFVQAQYVFGEDRVYLTDRTYSGSCAERPPEFGGESSKGIDCFGEMVLHEHQHMTDRHDWWGTTNPKTAPWSRDWDMDLVPNEVEESLSETRGCNPRWRESCSGVPDGKIDLEMNAYVTGWSWKRGTADGQDWSWCGKQWKDASVCPGGKIW